MTIADRMQLRAELIAWNAGVKRAQEEYYADLQVLEGYCAKGDGRKLNRATQRRCKQCYRGKR